MNEERNFEQTRYQERMLYGAELTRRIAIVLDTIDRYEYAFEPLENLVSILLPEIKKEIDPNFQKMKAGYQRQVDKFSYPTTRLPLPSQRRENASRYNPYIIQPENDIWSPGNHTGMRWEDLNPLVREQVFHYFPPGCVVQTENLLKISYYPFARSIIQQIISISDRMGLLLASSKSVEVGGGFGAQNEKF